MNFENPIVLYEYICDIGTDIFLFLFVLPFIFFFQEKYNKKNMLTDEIERIYGDDKGRNFGN